MRLDDEVRQVHEKYWTAEQAAARQKTVILVEGDDDRDVLETILDVARGRGWRLRLRVVAAGGYKKVLERRHLFPHAHLLLDRDTRTDDEVAALRSTNAPFCWVTEGWCLENILLDPDFTRTLRPGASLARAPEPWLCAGAVWWTLQRAREQQQLEWDRLWGSPFGRPHGDFCPTSSAEFRAKFPPMSRPSDLDALADTFERRLGEVGGMSARDQWRLGVHGKAAFEHLLLPALRREGEPDRPAKWWRAELARQVGRPAPLDALLATLMP